MRAGFVVACVIAFVALACGESRRPIGSECLRDDDCLSSYCAARTCVSAPELVTGANGTPPSDEPRIPGPDATSAPPVADAAGDT